MHKHVYGCSNEWENGFRNKINKKASRIWYQTLFEIYILVLSNDLFFPKWRIFYLWCLHIPITDRTPFTGLSLSSSLTSYLYVGCTMFIPWVLPWFIIFILNLSVEPRVNCRKNKRILVRNVQATNFHNFFKSYERNDYSHNKWLSFFWFFTFDALVPAILKIRSPGVS